ncbi:RNA polymerase sigma factor [Phytohabitans houttuyneae]|jgi:RNA polymerase sigma-70 factor (ECF subfamily)|uniref:DNA-directed RNA polymerase sigma-70 factor n=1 Tax=Phytohabitans houttuyneae TaxID=1076126 RepID=A0A6V8KJF1_9ACTN|nr:sigma-70 family RNA polymerase sigma factor [Phytohabitans houttuyneae]GFJ83994.1 DNA-directed RNA polymerase sigma-70 factor [Phytohabitans houttuyneae]
MRPSRERGEEWFTALYATHYPQVFRYALRRLADPDAAVDLAQEVFVVAWRRRVEVPDRGLPWLYGVARRLLANQWRARHAAPALVTLAAGGAPHERAVAHPSDGGAADRLAAVRAALATLSETDQEILRLVGWEELTVAEAATVLGCRRATAAVRLHRARRRLAESLRAVPLDEPSAAPIRL